MTSRVQVEAQPPIAVVRLDGPKRHNVLDRDGWLDLAEKLGTLSDRNDVSCVAVRGRGGRAFSAGSDIAAFQNQREEPADVRKYSAAIGLAMHVVYSCRHPTIAIIEGICVGGGLEIAACCDLRVCGESSRFGAPSTALASRCPTKRSNRSYSFSARHPYSKSFSPGSSWMPSGLSRWDWSIGSGQTPKWSRTGTISSPVSLPARPS